MSSIIKRAQTDTTDNIKGHIPEDPHSANFSNPNENVGNLRFVVFPSVYAQKLSVRVLRATVFRRLEPITNLRSGEEFMKVWFQCVQSHYARWERGVGRTDPSVVNFMTNPFDKNKGIFNDWDLAIVRVPDRENLPHSERTGTPPFMALDLLSKAYYDGHMKRLYRHDLEGFIWILPWVFLQYEKGNRASRVLRGWENSDYMAVHEKKSSFLNVLKNVKIMQQFGNEWVIAYQLLSWLLTEKGRRTEADSPASRSQNPTNIMAKKRPSFIRQSVPNAEAAPKEKEPKEVYSEFWNVIVRAIDNANDPAPSRDTSVMYTSHMNIRV